MHQEHLQYVSAPVLATNTRGGRQDEQIPLIHHGHTRTHARTESRGERWGQWENASMPQLLAFPKVAPNPPMKRSFSLRGGSADQFTLPDPEEVGGHRHTEAPWLREMPAASGCTCGFLKSWPLIGGRRARVSAAVLRAGERESGNRQHVDPTRDEMVTDAKRPVR